MRDRTPVRMGPGSQGGSHEDHGEVHQILGKKYPQDQAVGFQQGELRGMVTVIIPGE